MSLKILFDENDKAKNLSYTQMQSIPTSEIFDIDIYLHQLKKANEVPAENLEISNGEPEIVTSQMYGSLDVTEEVSQSTDIVDISPKNPGDAFTKVPLYDQIFSNAIVYKETSDVESPKETLGEIETPFSQTTLEDNLFSQLAFQTSNPMSFGNSGLERRVFSYTPWHIREPPKQSLSYYSTTSQRMPTLNYYRR